MGSVDPVRVVPDTSDAAALADALGAGAIRDLAARYDVRPDKALGQNFLVDPNTARAIVAGAEVAPGDRVVEVGAGLGSLTLPLAAAGAEVLAIEFDEALVPALEELVADLGNVKVLAADATKLDWTETLDGDAGSWSMVASLPYNVSVPLVQAMLTGAPAIGRWTLVVQREVGERFTAGPGEEGYGPVSIRTALHTASASIVRRIPATVFWPRPRVDSVVVRLERAPAPTVDLDEALLMRVVDTCFSQRRKTMRSAVRRLGLGRVEADAALTQAGIDPDARPDEVSLAGFASIAERVPS